jgi:C1A family cysteine protease
MRFITFISFIASTFAQIGLRGSESSSETAFVSTPSADSITFIDDEEYHWHQFNHFQERFSKRYESMEELEVRFDIFRNNLIHILAHNADVTQNFTMGINQFTDLTPEEFKKQYVSSYSSSSLVGSYGCKAFSSTASNAPNSVDWISKGKVNPVRDQGQCGSCWAFATTANAESVWAIYSGQLLDLSEELLVDCASGAGYHNLGCNGGNPDSAFKYMINNGQCSESSYPYKAGTTKTAGTCQKCSSAPVHFSACYDVKSNDQVSLKGAVSNQPVAVAIEADTRYFQSYSGGILDSASCGTNLDHAVEIVGYGTENGIDYWNVRNSWSASWGENGYVRIKKTSSTNDSGICGISIQPSFISV